MKSKGVDFHTSANKSFGCDSKPANVPVRGYSRALPQPRPPVVSAPATGGALSNKAVPMQKGRKGLTK